MMAMVIECRERKRYAHAPIRKIIYGLIEEQDSMRIEYLPGFEFEHKSNYYAHLVANPNIATTFMSLPLLYKVIWVTTFFNDRC
jgi:hypothetical protein